MVPSRCGVGEALLWCRRDSTTVCTVLCAQCTVLCAQYCAHSVRIRTCAKSVRIRTCADTHRCAGWHTSTIGHCGPRTPHCDLRTSHWPLRTPDPRRTHCNLRTLGLADPLQPADLRTCGPIARREPLLSIVSLLDFLPADAAAIESLLAGAACSSMHREPVR